MAIKTGAVAARNWSFHDKKSTIGTQPQPDIPASGDQHVAYEQYPPAAQNGPESPYSNRGGYAYGGSASPGYGYS
jgi:hypothetical protein